MHNQLKLRLVLLVVLLLMLSACAGSRPFSTPTTDGTSPPQFAGIPAPVSLKASSYTEAGLYRLGREFDDAFPHLNVSTQEGFDWVQLSAQWDPAAPSTDDLAWCIYRFSLADYDRAAELYLSFMQVEPLDNLWIGLSDFERNTWDWVAPEQDTPLPFDLDTHRDVASDEMYVLMLSMASADAGWNLEHIRVGPPVAPLINDITPLSFGVGQEVQLSADIGGSVPVSYSWDFGGVVPDSTEPAPVFTIFTAGEYECLLTVTNAAGEVSENFTLEVIELSDWLHSWGGVDNDSAAAVAIDSVGNIYAGGKTESFGDSGMLLKYGLEGTLLWTRRIMGDSVDEITALVADGAGHVYAVGATTSFGATWQDVFIAKFSTDGDLIWARRWGGENDERGIDVQLDSAGGLVVMASTQSFAADDSDYRSLVLLDVTSDGALEAGTVYTTAKSFYTDSGGLVLDAADNRYVAISTVLSPGYILKFTADGSLNAGITYDGIDYTELTDIALHDSGDVIICGSTRDSGADRQIIVMRFNPELSRIWSKQWGLTTDFFYDDFGLCVMVDENSNIWFGGDTSDMATNPYSAIIGYVSAVGATLGLRAWSMTNDDSSGKDSIEAANAMAWHPAGKPVVAGFCGYSGGEWEAVAQEGADIPAESVGTAVGARASLDTIANPLVDITGDVDTSPLSLGIEDDGGGQQDALVIFGTPLE